MPISRLEIPLVITLMVLSPNLLDLWASPQGGWLSPFIIWSGVIIVAIWLEKQRTQDDL